MASTYSTSLRLELMATGDQSGTWGDTTNTNLGTLLEQAITGVLSVAEGDTTLTLSNLNGASDQARNAVINLTGAMTAGRDVVVPAPNKLYLIKNSTSGGFAVTVKTPSGTGVAVPAGTARWVYANGTDVVDGLSGPWTPSTNSGAALGTSSVAWSALFIDSSSAGTLATLSSTDAGATAGPVVDLYRNSATPAANDILGKVLFNGEDSAGNTQEYASIEAVITDPTSTTEDGDIDMYATVAGTRRKLFSINSTQALYGRSLPVPSNDATDPTNDIVFSAGAASDVSTTATGLMWVACASLIKRLDANWAAGTNQGMRYSGAAIANTTYHLWACWTDAGVQDYYADPSAVQATVLGHLQAESGGSAYTHLSYIGAIIRVSAAIKPFVQTGRTVVWTDAPLDFNVVNPGGGAAYTATLTTPSGISVLANITCMSTDTAAGNSVLLSSLSTTDVTVVGTDNCSATVNTVGGTAVFNGGIVTDTSSAIRGKNGGASATLTVNIRTRGFTYLN